MATVNRRKPTKSGKTTRRNPVSKRNQPKKGFPFIAAFIAIILIGFICYFIFAVEKPASAPELAAKKEQVKNEETLPEKPQPQWEYEEILKTKEIEVDIPEEKASTTSYQMQCGSFRKKEDAEALKAKIAFQGLSSQATRSGDWYRVILGPYEHKRLADKDNHKLQRARINGCLIWQWR